ncbi:MAG TPA: hypothetical protein VGQ99_23870 [Tepidisphaeraceae bacterium]|jgi:hypothetical protein|nr:hypothetical protein [Tepidisphaeraceae bacterium]
MSKTEIMAELAHLSPQDLAEVRAWLDRLARDKGASRSGPSAAPRIRSPRLANPAQAKDFIKQVRELPPHAGV